MEKKVLFSVLFFSVQLIWEPAFANIEPFQAQTFAPSVLNCYAPPPDSFRLTGFGNNFVTLAWVPVSAGDSYLLSVFIEDKSNGWDSLYSVELSNTLIYTLNYSQPKKKHKIEIRTKCSSGEFGTEISSLIPPFGLILELTVGGRTPIDPKPAAQCSFIGYQDHKWIGFSLIKRNENISDTSLFEFVKVDDLKVKGNIKRLPKNNYSLVAANALNEWPLDVGDEVRTYDLAFTAGEIENLVIDGFGVVDVGLTIDYSSVSLCPSPLYQINYPFEFEVLVANRVVSSSTSDPINPSQGRMKQQTETNPIRVKSPFSGNLNIFFPEIGFESGLKRIVLQDINGKVIFRELVYVSEPQISIPIPHCSTGLYILCIESSGQVQKLKVFKQ